MTILKKFSHVLTIYIQIERKNRYRYQYTFRKAKIFTLVFKTAFLLKLGVKKNKFWSRYPEPVKIGPAPQHCLHVIFT